MKTVRFAILLIATLLYAVNVHAATPSHKKVTALIDTYKKIKNLTANFHQTVTFAEFDTAATSTGSVFLKKGKMRWDYLTPQEQQIFIDDKQIAQYTPELAQVIKSPIRQRTGLPIDLFLQIEKIRDLFEITESGRDLLFVPKGVSTSKILITLTQVGSGLFVQKVVLSEQNGNQSTFLFSDFKINQKISDDFFVLKLPQGVEVITP